MKARDLRPGDKVRFIAPDWAEYVYRDLEEEGSFDVIHVGPDSVELKGRHGKLHASDRGLLLWAEKVEETNDDSNQEESQGEGSEVSAVDGKEVGVYGPEVEADEDEESEAYFEAKADKGKPEARLIPLHSFVHSEDYIVRDLANCIFSQKWYEAIHHLDEYIQRKYSEEDIISFAQKALDYGLEKYGKEGGWADVPDGERRYRDAASRHFLAFFWYQEENDPESGLNHLCHLAANLLFLNSGELDDA